MGSFLQNFRIIFLKLSNYFHCQVAMPATYEKEVGESW